MQETFLIIIIIIINVENICAAKSLWNLYKLISEWNSYAPHLTSQITGGRGVCVCARVCDKWEHEYV